MDDNGQCNFNYSSDRVKICVINLAMKGLFYFHSFVVIWNDLFTSRSTKAPGIEWRCVRARNLLATSFIAWHQAKRFTDLLADATCVLSHANIFKPLGVQEQSQFSPQAKY
jgi:hypothetical protein